MWKKYSDSQKELWKEKILSQQKSSLSVTNWCRENNIHPRVFYYWRQKLFSKNSVTRSSFTELSGQQQTEITLEYHGAIIRFDQNLELSALKKCLIALRSIKC